MAARCPRAGRWSCGTAAPDEHAGGGERVARILVKLPVEVHSGGDLRSLTGRPLISVQLTCAVLVRLAADIEQKKSPAAFLQPGFSTGGVIRVSR